MHDIFVVKTNNLNSDIIEHFPHAKIVEYNSNKIKLFADVAKQSVTKHAWIISGNCDYDGFDFDYVPPWHQNSQLHVWPTENQHLGGDTVLINAQEFLKQADMLDALQNYQDVCWKQQSVKQSVKPEIFVWSKSSAAVVPIADAKIMRYTGDRLSMLEKTIRRATTPYIWIINDELDYTDFNFDWRPAWAEESYLHVWPTENQTLGGDTFYVNVKQFLQQQHIESLDHYQTICWHEQSIPQKIKPEVFVWDKGNAIHLKNLYPDAKVIRYIGSKFDMMVKTAAKATTPYIWVLSDNCNYDTFDFDWRPGWAIEKYLQVWPTENQTQGGDTFYVNVSEFKTQALEMQTLNDYCVINWHQQSLKENQKPDLVIWDNGKNTGNLEYLKNQFPEATVLRNVGSRFDMMQRTARHVKTRHAWIINSKCSYTDFDFDWRPDWATEQHLHVWPTENQIKGGDTFYVDVAEFQKQCLEIEKLEYYNAVTWHEKNVPLTSDVDIIIWSYGGNLDNLNRIQQTYPNAKTLRYIGTHLEMLKKSTKYTDSEYFWILGDCCDYSNFTTNWRPDWETENSIHCWASGTQKFGDTFYVPKAEFVKEADSLEKLEYFSSIVWHENGYPRLPWPVNYIEIDDIYSTVKNHTFTTLYEYFVAPGSTIGSTVDTSLWEKRLLIAYNRNGHVSLCPRDVINSISTRLLDYPYIQYHNCEKSTEKSQNIVFISYDEKDADLNYKILKDRFPHAKRIHGVKGNVAAYKEAAKISDTPWYYAVFPKTKIDPTFNFNYHPNYLETPGHYIFNAHNVITDYGYGHGGVKMYHVKTTIEIENWGYDFTMSSPVTTIPVNSCYLEPATEYEAWRTSFREVLKLKNDNSIEGRYRLHRWLTVGNGEFGEYSKAGAAAALEYNGDTKVANSWEWLREQFDSRYS